MCVGRGDGDKISIAHDDNAGNRFRFGQVDVGEFCAEGRSAEDFSVQHAGADDVGGIGVRASDDLAAIRTGGGDAEDFPILGGRQLGVGRCGLLEGRGIGSGEVGVGAMDVPFGERGKQLARGGGGARTLGSVRGVVPLPAVMPSSGTRSVSAMTSETWARGTPSSSAAACVISARAPWPHSTLPVRTVMAPSLAIWRRASSGAGRPEPTPRRGVVAAAFLRDDRGGSEDEQAGADDLDEGAATEAEVGGAEVVANDFDDLIVAGFALVRWS